MSDAIWPGAVLGILGGGQLGRMSAMAAHRLGYRVVILDATPDSPAAQVADRALVAPFDDRAAVAALADQAEVVTFEFENVPASVVRQIADRPVRPGPDVLAVAQHRLKEKETLQALGAPVGPFSAVRNVQDLHAAVAALGLPALLKTATGGYDGKGQLVLITAADVSAAAGQLAAGGRDWVLEAYVPFERELSVVVARGVDGETVSFPVAENIHRRNILHVSVAPARVAEGVQAAARQLGERIAAGLGVVGLLAVEMFLVGNDRLYVNELAPRPHNSGHYTLDACVTSQFEQHVRAVCGLPLGSTAQRTPAVMVNVLGQHLGPLLQSGRRLLGDPWLKLHLYGKGEARPDRKMGHVTALAPTLEEALARAAAAWECFGDGEPLLGGQPHPAGAAARR